MCCSASPKAQLLIGGLRGWDPGIIEIFEYLADDHNLPIHPRRTKGVCGLAPKKPTGLSIKDRAEMKSSGDAIQCARVGKSGEAK